MIIFKIWSNYDSVLLDWNDTDPTSIIYQFHHGGIWSCTNGDSNENDYVQVWQCRGYSKFGSYEGNNPDGVHSYILDLNYDYDLGRRHVIIGLYLIIKVTNPIHVKIHIL